jgi:hypothetical protein
MSNIKIINPNETYDFTRLTLGNPVQTNNNMFFSKISCEDDLYIQTPEISCKDGFIKNSKKPYIDLVFDQSHEAFVEWVENLETTVKKCIYEKRNEWFQDSNVDITDIDNIFISPFRTYKSGKKLILRVYLETPKSLINKNDIEIYDENENELSLDSIDVNSIFIALLHINGLRFSSKTFQIYIDVKQIMVITNKLVNEKVLIKNNKPEMKPEDAAREVKPDDALPQVKSVETTTEMKPDETLQEVKLDILKTSTETKLDETVINLKEDESIIEGEQIKTSDEKKINSTDEIIKTTETEEILDIKEVDLNLDSLENDNIQLNKPTKEHIEQYKDAIAKAKTAQKKALELHLEAKNIKAKYLLNIDSDTDSD